jgi:phage FluMu protein Com
MNESGQIQCARCGKILSLDEIEKKQCNRCKAFYTDIGETKHEEKGINPDSKRIEAIKSKYEAEKIPDPGIGKVTRSSGCIIVIAIISLIPLIILAANFLLKAEI